MTTGQVYIDFKNKLGTIYDAREAETISDWVFEDLFGMKKWERRMNRHQEIKISDYQQSQQYLTELLTHKPIQYVLHEAWFYKMKFFVNEDVLIPRPETEELVEWIVNEFDKPLLSEHSTGHVPGKQTNLLEVGTGSGCISIALSRNISEANVTAIDLSEKALNVARKNAGDLGASVNFLQADFLDETRWNEFSGFDIIVSNPPYVPIQEKESLQKNVVDFEPGVALFVDDDDPLIFYERIAKFSKTHLNEGGKIYVEIHETKAAKIKEVFQREGFAAIVKKDMYGKNRMVKAIRTAVNSLRRRK